ncbi:HAD family hydrolase [Chondromyces crocatus]|uniref:phosphoglycolate phosphatase n=1 Tax=Chondromyces crocatus TaxID=52 RepID=A0A0K1E7R7_CHOCO|nr:HAD-IA family hydrolase [Chondromyces crocatus]AKT36910.1 phosphoglycolate phosphatase [Chondromyces crocatus]
MLVPAAVVFDLDGTLIDSRGDIVAAVNHALSATGRRPLPAQLIVRFIGDGARALCARTAGLPEASDEVEPLLSEFIAYYRTHPVEFTRWMPGAQEALEQIADWDDLTVALCTNKPRQVTESVLSALGVRSRFRAIIAEGDVSERKPSPMPLQWIARVLGMETTRLVMVGDGPQDIESARRAGARSVGLLNGYAPRERLAEAKPDVLIPTLFELRDVLRRWRDVTVRLSSVAR